MSVKNGFSVSCHCSWHVLLSSFGMNEVNELVY